MHEMSLAESVRSIVEETAHAHGAHRVSVIVLEIGALAAVDVDALHLCLAAVLRGTVAADARIEIDTRAASGQCDDCGASMAIAARYEPCPQCGSYRVTAVSGTEMRVAAVEMAYPETNTREREE